MPKPLGQHFLKNKSAIEKIIAAIDPQPDETIIEIGPGHGELTLPLAEVCEKIDAKIVAIEKDEKLANELRTKLGENLEMMHGDALIALAALTSKPVNPTRYKIVGNIPYYITGHLLRVISELENQPKQCVFMIQKEVAERICAVPPKMNRLAASVQFWADPKIIMALGKGDFSPPPKVDSAVILLKNKFSAAEHSKARAKNAEQYYLTVRTLFAQPRKTILNNLSTAANAKSKEKIAEILQAIHINPKSRPQNLAIEDIQAIADACA